MLQPPPASHEVPPPLHAHMGKCWPQDPLLIVIIFASSRDLSHTAAKWCLQDAKARKTRLTKPACELSQLAEICHTS